VAASGKVKDAAGRPDTGGGHLMFRTSRVAIQSVGEDQDRLIEPDFSSRALKRFWERGDASRLPPQFVSKIGMVLDALDAATTPGDVDLPGFGFHALKGDRRGQYAITITGNWRATFRWQGEDAIDVDFEDYHGG
jgi:proteic killer suppression protein